jgi:hypothetical protein
MYNYLLNLYLNQIDILLTFQLPKFSMIAAILFDKFRF